MWWDQPIMEGFFFNAHFMFEAEFSFKDMYLENKLLLIPINFTPKTSHSCLKKCYFPMFSR